MYSAAFLLCNISFAQANAQLGNLPETAYWTAPYTQLFDEADYVYPYKPQLTYKILDIIAVRAEQTNEYKWQFEAFRSKGLYLERQIAYQSALDCYFKAQNAVKNKDLKKFRNIQTDIAICYRNLNNYVEARKIYLNQIELCLTAKDSNNLQDAYGGLGLLFFTVNNYENAVKYYEKAVDISKKIKDYYKESLYLDNLAEAFGSLKQYDKAFAAISLATQIAEREKDDESKIPLCDRYARLYADINNWNGAFQKIDEGLRICLPTNFRDKNNLMITKAELFLLNGQRDSAKNILLNINESYININSLIKVYYELGKIFESEQNITQATFYYKKCQILSEKNQSFRYDEFSNRALYKIYRAQNNASQALAHLERANALHDSLFNYEKSGQVTELQFRYDLAQSEQKIKEAELQVNKVLMFAGAALSILIVTFLGFWIYIRGRKNRILSQKNNEIREQKQQLELFNKEIEAQKRQLEESNGMLKQFNYAVAHDLKEPLRNIGSFISIIQRRYMKDLPADATSYFEFVTNGASRMGKMLEGLLKYSMLTMDQVTDIEDLDLKEVFNDVVESLLLIIKEKQAQVLIPEKMPHLAINRIHLIQVIQNLIANALKFTDKTPIITVSCTETDTEIQLDIADNGIGINPESGKKLFQLFHRLHRDTTKFEGTGVGLALCKSIVEKYGGTITFSSVEGEGTTFHIQFKKAQ